MVAWFEKDLQRFAEKNGIVFLYFWGVGMGVVLGIALCIIASHS